MIDSATLAAYIASRVCHDIVSPASSVSSAIDLLDEPNDAEMREQANSLLRDGAAKVEARLKFLRYAFGSMGLDRQRALWQIKPLRDASMPLFETVDGTDQQEAAAGLDRLPSIAPATRVLQDYSAVGLSLKAHPVSFVREDLAQRGAITARDLRNETQCLAKRSVSVAGLVLCRQRPGTASGVTFITLEDETGITNLIIWKDTFERYRRIGRLARLLLAHGTVERQGIVVHVHVHRLESIDSMLSGVAVTSRDFH